MPPASWPDWISAIASLFSAFGVMIGFWFANRQLSNWRLETFGKRQAEVAEEVLAAAEDASAALKYMRAAARHIQQSEGETFQEAMRRDAQVRTDSTNEAFRRLRAAQVRADALLENSEISSALETLFEVRWDAAYAFTELQRLEAVDNLTEDEREVRNKYRFKAYGSYTEKYDPLGMRQIAAMDQLREAARPYIRLSSMERRLL